MQSFVYFWFYLKNKDKETQIRMEIKRNWGWIFKALETRLMRVLVKA